VRRVAVLLGQEPAAIPLDMAAIAARLASISPVAAGMTPKRLANIRSDFRAAIKASGMLPVSLDKRPLNPAWQTLFERLAGRAAPRGGSAGFGLLGHRDHPFGRFVERLLHYSLPDTH
jgi:hypothetical protein